MRVKWVLISTQWGADNVGAKSVWDNTFHNAVQLVEMFGGFELIAKSYDPNLNHLTRPGSWNFTETTNFGIWDAVSPGADSTTALDSLPLKAYYV